jgi:hypothetical protein
MPSLGFDTSSYPATQVAPQDPLAMIGKILQIQGAQQGLAMQQQEFKARQAMGPIFQSAIDQQTGELDTGKLMLGLSHPDVAYKAPEIMMQLIQRKNVEADTVMKQLSANKIRYGAMGDAAGSLVAQAEQDAAGKVNIATGGAGTPGITNKQMASTLSTLIGENGLIDAKDAAEILTKTAGMNDAQRFQFAKNFANSARGVDKTMGDIYGAIVAHNTGGGTALVQNRPLIGATRQVGGLETTPTPAEMNAPVAGVTPQGQPTIRPRVQAAPMYGGSGAPIAGSGGASAPTGLSPQEKKLQEDRAKGAVEYENALTETNTVGQENLRVLREMQDAMKEFKTGGGMEVRQRLSQLAQGLGMPNKLVDEIAGGNRGALAEFQKLAVRYATQEMKTNMGSGQRFTNLDFSTFLKNNPTIDTDPRGLDKMFKFLEQGVWRAGQQQEAHQQWKGGWRPKGFESSGIDSFPVWWTKILSDVNKKSP